LPTTSCSKEARIIQLNARLSTEILHKMKLNILVVSQLTKLFETDLIN